MSIHSNTQFHIQVIIEKIVWRSKHSFPIYSVSARVKKDCSPLVSQA